MEDLIGKLPDLRRQCCREEDRLTLSRESLHHLHDVVEESHIQHPIRLIKDKVLNPREVDLTTLQMRQQTTWRSDNHIGTTIQTTTLHIPRLAIATTIDHRSGYIEVVGEALKLCVDLHRQLTCRHHDDRVDLTLLILTIRLAIHQQAQQRKRKGCRLTRTRLRTADEVSPLEYDWYCLLLNWGHLLETHLFDRIQYVVVQI